MTLKSHYAQCFKTRASFGADHENLNEDRLTLSATKMYPMTLLSSNKVCADAGGGSLETYVNYP